MGFWKSFVLIGIWACLHSCQPGNKTEANAKDPAALFTPEEAIKDFKVEDGFEVQCVASEPLVEDPVAFQFDETGAMWVVEMRGYMHDKEGGGEDQPLGRIKILQDANGDGIYEKADIFLDSLIMPRAVAPAGNGILYIEPPKLFFIENNGGKAGKKTLIDSAFAEGGNVEHMANGLMRAMDNWIYSAKSNKRVRNIKGKWVIEKTFQRGQWGIDQDNYGRLFYNDNSNILFADVLRPNAMVASETYRYLSKDIYGKRMIGNAVYPARTTPGVNRGYEKGVLDSNEKLANATAACGPVVYRGDQFPEDYQENVFVMEPSAYLIKRIEIKETPDGSIKGEAPYINKEFLTATDERFRPVSAATAPDGTLYFIDMHRGIIQHTRFLTPYLRNYIDSLNLQRPIGMGRIYRIKWKEHGLSKKLDLSKKNPKDLVALLSHKNGWVRDVAQRLLVEKQDTTILKALTDSALSQNPITALHALYVMEGLDALHTSLLMHIAANNPSQQVHLACMQLLPKAKDAVNILPALQKLKAKKEPFTNVLYVSGLLQMGAPDSLMAFLKSSLPDTIITDAVVSAYAKKESQLLKALKKNNIGDSIMIKGLQSSITRRAMLEKDPRSKLTAADRDLYNAGQYLYPTVCSGCHGKDGEGINGVAPPLFQSGWVLEKDKSIPIKILLDGLHGPVIVNGKTYGPPEITGTMPGLRHSIETNNGNIAGILTYIRKSWGHNATPVTVEDVGRVRDSTQHRQQPYTAEELKPSKN